MKNRGALMRLVAILACMLALPLAFSFAQEVRIAERHLGKVVQRVGFHSWTNLSFDELMNSIALRPGMDITPELLAESVSGLLDRGVFNHVDVLISDEQEGAYVEFDLVSFLTVHEIEFVGNGSINSNSLNREVGINRGDLFSVGSLVRAQARIKQLYRDEGFYHSDVKVDVLQRGEVPEVFLRFIVSEGEPALVRETVIWGDFPPELDETRALFLRALEGIPASRTAIQRIIRELVIRLRSEGYLQSRVTLSEVTIDPLSGSARVEVVVSARQPLAISFEGNRTFSAEALLQLLEIETRTVPFSPYAIPNLVREIEKHYQNYGFLYAQATLRELPPTGSRRQYLITLDEGPQVRLNSISFEGNQAISQAELEELMITKPAGRGLFIRWQPGFITLENLENDLQVLEELYQERGFIGTTVSYRLDETDQTSLLDLIIEVDEQSLKQIAAVDVIWKDAPTGEFSLDYAPQLGPEDPIDSLLLENERLRLQKVFIEAGFPKATVNLSLDRLARQVTYTIESGPQVQVGRIVNAGNVFTRDSVIRRELRFQEGDMLNATQMAETIQRLYRLGLFSSVSVEPLDASLNDPVEDLVVRVQERDTGSYGLGIGIDSEDGLNLSGDLTQRNFDGEGQTLILAIDGYVQSGETFFDAGLARLAYRDPYFLETPLEFLAEGFIQGSIKHLNDFSYNRAGAKFGLEHEIDERISLDFGVSPYFEELFDVPPQMIIGDHDSGNAFYSFVKSSITYDGRDDRFNPREGLFSVLEARLSSETIASEVDIGGLSWQGGYHYPLATRWTLGTNLSLKYLVPFNDTDTVPLGQRFFLGGRNSLRGFSPNTIGPRADSGDIVGGDTSAVANFELQYLLLDNFLGVLFFDAGQTVLRNPGTFAGDPLTLALSDLRFSPGIGFRYQTPIGPIGLEYGVALDREYGEGLGTFHFSIGTAF